MADIRGYFNVVWAGRAKINGSLMYFADTITNLENIDLYNFSDKRVDCGAIIQGAIYLPDYFNADTPEGTTYTFVLPTGYYYKISKHGTSTINVDYKFYDQNNTVLDQYTNFAWADTWIGFARYNRVNSTDSYISKFVLKRGTPNTIRLFRPIQEIQAGFNFPWITTDDPLGTLEPIDEGEGGYGDFDYTSDDDTFPDLPTTSITKAGFVNLFKLDQTGIESLANYLWSGLFDVATYIKLFSDPMECILSLGLVPVDPPASSPLYIVVGNHATTVQAPRINSNWYELDCGSITLEGSKYSNSFMDYSPYSKAELYLPYVGTVGLDIDEIMDSTIQIKYHIDLLSGSCVAYVKVTKRYNYKGASHTHSNVMYQFSGNVLMNIPITSQNFTQVLQAVIGAVAVGVSGTASLATTGEVGGMFTEEQAGSLIGATQQMKPPVSRSGNCSSACGILGTQKPKLMLTMPKIAYAEDMNKERGYPTYMRKTLSSMSGSGFCKIDLAHIKGIPCTDTERDEIIRLLESGVEL